jgi:ATPase
MKSYMPDTSAIIEGAVIKLLKKKKIDGKVLLHKAVIAELEHQANFGKDVGFLGFEEINRIRNFLKSQNIEMEYVGERPTKYHIRRARMGEIDAQIRDVAWDMNATLITCDRIQAESAKAMGMDVLFLEKAKKRKKLLLEKFFQKDTMSAHLKEDTLPFSKNGSPGNWTFTKLSTKPITHDKLHEIARQIIEEARTSTNGFIEVERRGSTIVQLGQYRIVITWTPFSDGLEITAVRPVKKMRISDYKMDKKLMDRFEKKAEGILIAGAPGAGKSTFAQALAEFYAKKDKIVKTIEAPRDLQLPKEITQYSKNIGTSDEVHDVLLLSRPDYTIFDEMRNTSDFRLYSDLRLAGVGMVGVVHATTPIDAIQRFIGRVELGMIASILDTVVFIKEGFPEKVFDLKMTVKVPTGMTEADLARPVIEIRDFVENTLEYEIYSFGEETAVIPVTNENAPMRELASKAIESEIKRTLKTENVRVEVPGDRKAVVYVDPSNMARIIGKKGERINSIEKKLGVNIDVRELAGNGEEVGFDMEIGKKDIILHFDRDLIGRTVQLEAEGNMIFSSKIGKDNQLKIKKNSKLGKILRRASFTERGITALV